MSGPLLAQNGASVTLNPASYGSAELANGIGPAGHHAGLNGHAPGAAQTDANPRRAVLECKDDGAFYGGLSFGAEKSVAGELVFQTGMVGYPESITDPSYRGQILVLTFPLVGNYGVPSREARDELLKSTPAHFESAQLHIAGLVVATYAGEEYSHYLAASSLGTWLKEQGIPAVYGVDTRALTKKIRESGSMLGRLLMANSAIGSASEAALLANGSTKANGALNVQADYESVAWRDPNQYNLVAEGETRMRNVGISSHL